MSMKNGPLQVNFLGLCQIMLQTVADMYTQRFNNDIKSLWYDIISFISWCEVVWALQ